MLFSCYSMQKKKKIFFKLSNNWSFLLATSTHIQSHLYESLSTSHKEDGEGHGRLIYSPWASLFFIDDRSLLGSELGSWHQGLQDAQSKLNMEVIGTKIPAPELQQMKSQPPETCKLDALPRLDVDEGGGNREQGPWSIAKGRNVNSCRLVWSDFSFCNKLGSGASKKACE